jgi:hypothetical protein
VRGLGWCATAIAILSILSAGAIAEPPQQVVARPPAGPGDAAMETVLVEAQRLRELQRQVSTFVSAITIHNRADSIARWQLPICPLVAGLPFEQGTFVFQRVSQVASAAGIPLDADDCRPNLLVVMAEEPEELIRRWWGNRPQLFNKDRGVGGIERTIGTDAPVRVFYNACSVPAPGMPNNFAAVDLICGGGGTVGSKLKRGAIRAIYSVIVVVDKKQTNTLELGALTDYIAMIALAQVSRGFDSGPGNVPTILRLFDETDAARPQALSKWDQAFLKSLYNVDPVNTKQKSQILGAMARDLAR